MSENDRVLVDALTDLVRRTAYQICGEQPGVPQPEQLSDLDSFSVVQVLLELEKSTELMLLEELGSFRGSTFEELAENIVEIARDRNATPELAGRVRDLASSDQAPSA
ncbi:hypothetical protein [Saccharomonospora glauca]|jgi:hypothetical protein|uniref:Carrier domain-containing protein n=1 Tax=Saccharomonospora glauca K62 TaxID=928724 RepID=I1D207_9PSEU|nr:hypothetical protein [Saccharomonospora glauca]EIE98981.1 hypothetical protein SacglDRAFT_02076 [Saccharomonospora glauca K62]